MTALGETLEKQRLSRDNGPVTQIRIGVMGGNQLGHRFAEGFAYTDAELSTTKK